MVKRYIGWHNESPWRPEWFVLIMMILAIKMMIFVLKMINFVIQMMKGCHAA